MITRCFMAVVLFVTGLSTAEAGRWRCITSSEVRAARTCQKTGCSSATAVIEPSTTSWLVCNRCHRAIHDKLPEYGELPKGAVLAAKWEEDGFFDPAILAALKHRKALPYDPCPIPEKFLADRRRNGGKP